MDALKPPDPAPAAASAGLCEICGRREAPAILIDGVPKTACWRAWPGNAAHGREYETLHAFDCYRIGYERLRAASAGEGALREEIRQLREEADEAASSRDGFAALLLAEEQRTAALRRAFESALNWAGHHEEDGMHWIASESFIPEECPCAALAPAQRGD